MVSVFIGYSPIRTRHIMYSLLLCLILDSTRLIKNQIYKSIQEDLTIFLLELISKRLRWNVIMKYINLKTKPVETLNGQTYFQAKLS